MVATSFLASAMVEATRFYVYILRSQVDGTLYKGYSSDYERRFAEHNSGLSVFTSRKMPWDLIYVEVCESKGLAIRRERQLKRANQDYLSWLVGQKSNLLHG